MTVQTESKPVDATQGEAQMAPPPKLRRRPMLWALGIALIALGGLLAAWITTTVSDSESVLALRADVDRGTTIEAEDLVAVQISGDPSLQVVPASQQEDIVGQRASRDLTVGSLLPASAVTDEVIPGDGESLVGVALTRAQLPASPLRAGDVVRVINTPRAQEDLDMDAQAFSIDATVVGMRNLSDTGQVVVDVTVPTSDASQLATLVATGRVTLVVDGGQ